MAACNAALHRTVFFVALFATSMALGAAMAHVLELPNKIDLPREQYFVVQQAYRGWSQLAYLLILELASMITLAVLSWHESRVFWPVIIAILCLLSAQAVFWAFTYPANVATNNWTTAPANWDELRKREYSHAVGAFFQVLAMSALIVAVLRRSS